MRSKAQREREAYARKFGEEAEVIRQMPCVFAGRQTVDGIPHKCSYGRRCVHGVWESYTDPAHVLSVGAGGGPFDLVPMCRKAHGAQHLGGIETMGELYGLDLRALADEIALSHEPPLGLRGAAEYWLARQHEAGLEWPSNVGDPIFDHAEALDRWVRRRLVQLAAEGRDREAMAHAIMLELGGSFHSDPHGAPHDARLLCETAGWPS